MNEPMASSSLSSHLADQVVRHFWIVFNNIALYGREHPLTSKAVGTLFTYVVQGLGDRDSLTFHLQEENLICEDFRISPSMYGPRLISRLKDARIQSLTFYQGIDKDGLDRIVGVLGDTALTSVDEMAAILKEQQVTGFRFNYVTYQKVTIDESIVKNDLHKLAELFSLGNLAHKEQDSQFEVLSGPSHVTQDTTTTFLSNLNELRSHLNTVPLDHFPSPEEIVESLAALQGGVMREFGRTNVESELNSVESRIVSQTEQLTFDLLCTMIVAEFKKGTTPPNRLAHLIRRLVPDTETLKRFLPHLKKALLDNGMDLDAYLDLVQHLMLEMKEEELTVLLEEAGEEFGVGATEIVAALKKDPPSAVSLILLAAELNTLNDFDREKTRESLNAYFEKIGTMMDPTISTDAPGAQPAQVESALDLLEESYLGHVGEGRATIASLAKNINPSSLHVAPPLLAETGAQPAGGFQQWMSERGYHPEQMRAFSELTEEIGMLLGPDIEKLDGLLADYCTHEAAVQSSDAVDAAVCAIEKSFVELLGANAVDEERISTITSRFLESIRLPEPKTANAGTEIPTQSGPPHDTESSVALDRIAGAVNGFFSQQVSASIDLSGFTGGVSSDTPPALDALLADLESYIMSRAATTGMSDRQQSFLRSYLFKSIDAILAGKSLEVSSVVTSPTAESGDSPDSKSTTATPKRAKRAKLDRSILKNREIRTFLESEIKRSLRYKTPFATCALSLVHQSPNPNDPIDPARLYPMLNILSSVISPLLRDIDTIGVPDGPKKNFLLIIFPMTDEAGVRIVERRIHEACTVLDAPDDDIGPFSIHTFACAFNPSRSKTVTGMLRIFRQELKSLS